MRISDCLAGLTIFPAGIRWAKLIYWYFFSFAESTDRYLTFSLRKTSYGKRENKCVRQNPGRSQRTWHEGRCRFKRKYNKAKVTLSSPASVYILTWQNVFYLTFFVFHKQFIPPKRARNQFFRELSLVMAFRVVLAWRKPENSSLLIRLSGRKTPKG